jgi:hypothetical protein
MVQAIRHASTSCFIAVGLLLSAASQAQVTPVLRLGSEFRVNTTTVGNQAASDVATDANGKFVIAWHGPDPDNSGIFFQRYDAAGNALGGETQVAKFVDAAYPDLKPKPGFPSVAMDAAGRFAVAWTDYLPGNIQAVRVQRHSAAGVPQGGIIEVASGGDVDHSDIAMDAYGRFVVVWTGAYGSNQDAVFARLYRADGSVLKTIRAAESGPYCPDSSISYYYCPNYRDPRVARGANGQFVVTWSTYNAASGFGNGARLFTVSGAALADLGGFGPYVRGVEPALDANGNVLLVWEKGQYGLPYATVQARRYDASGTPQGEPSFVGTANASYRPKSSMDAAGNYVVTYEYWSGPGTSSVREVRARLYNADGSLRSEEFQANTYAGGNQWYPSVTMAAAGNLVVAWSSDGQDGDQHGIYAQRFAPTDGTPDAFDFVDQTARRHQVVFSNTVVVSGINTPVMLTLTGHSSARFSINGGALQSGSSSVNLGDTVRLRLISPTTVGASNSATANIGGLTDTWKVTTSTDR